MMKTFFMSVWFNIFLLILLFILSAFFSGSETSLFSLSRARVRRLRDHSGPGGKLAARLLQTPGKLLITILVGNLLVNIAVSSMLATSFTEWLGNKGAAAAVLASTFLLLIFGEVTPKTLAMIHPEKFARYISYPIGFFTIILTPFRYVLRIISNLILLLLKQKSADSDALLTREEFIATLHKSKSEGGIENDEAEIIHAITSFQTTVAKEVMIPRREMVCINENLSLRDAIRIGRKNRHTHLPVFHNNIDHICYILNIEHLISWRKKIAFEKKIAEFKNINDPPNNKLKSFLLPALLMPELYRLDQLLKNLKEKEQEIAILLDEYGGTAGMVSKHDIIDTLLGGISGGTSTNSGIHILQNGDIIASGNARISKLNWECGLNLPEELDDTLAGYVMRSLGAIPKSGNFFTDNNYEFHVLKMDENKVDTIRIKSIDEPTLT